jgi:acyl carrier protein phosphodiesterase
VNFLAHAYLSGGVKDLIIGNFIADAVKGKEYKNYRQGIIEGILLHRKIDSFTDQHSLVTQTKIRLRPHFGKYSSVVSDLYYDHFLALHWKDYSQTPLKEFTSNIYHIIQNEIEIMPEDVKFFFPYMVKNDWLYNYSTFYGMQLAFEGMSRRAKFDSKMDRAVEVLQQSYSEFEEDFRQFFPELKEFVLKDLNPNS